MTVSAAAKAPVGKAYRFADTSSEAPAFVCRKGADSSSNSGIENDVKCPDRVDWFVASLKKMKKSSR